jgi:hypothetical protein
MSESRVTGVIFLFWSALFCGFWAFDGFQNFWQNFIGTAIYMLVIIPFALLVMYLGAILVLTVVGAALEALVLVLDFCSWVGGLFCKKGDENVPVHCS